ncbi:ABC transporter permease (plasmid) [Rhizobium sp. TH2]|uniref:ABC transporter permease n=1 Tax=Rhizobium sp. TH2 TaxID=2775403 RepID=UPI002158516D|nr:ABC transporter permease [Rhizobium sp. TH2]UVC12221.1 ABC transporter permease [Rhizobium sp. TH2]
MTDTTQNAAVLSSKLFGSFSVRDAGTLIGLIAIVVIFGLLAPDFLSQRNLLNILQQSSINACLALGMTLVIISGGIDLSVGPTAAISAVITATMLVVGVPVPLAILAGLAIGAICGLVNGVLVAYAGLQPFIVTLGTLSTYRAIALIYTGGNPVLGIPPGFRSLFNGSLLGLPISVVMVAVVALLAWVLLKKTPLGEYLLAVGGNEEAAYVAGVPIAITKITAYVISGVLAALASMILIGRLGAAEPILGNLWELDAIAAAAIGGASLMGGKGSIIGTILGAIILGAMRNGLTLMNVQAFYQLLATGLIILVAMMIDRVTRGQG